jgi:hypothetical protein
MSIKRQKATAIMQGLFADLAATGSFKALAIVKKAWTIESEINNLQDALEELQDAKKEAKDLVAAIDRETKEGAIDPRWATAAAPMADVITRMMADITGSIALIPTANNYWNTTGIALLHDMLLRTNQLIAQVSSLEVATREGAGFGPRNFGKNDIANKTRKLERTLIAARNEIKNAMEAADIDPAAVPAAVPAATPTATPAASVPVSAAESGSRRPSRGVYMQYINGAYKLLDDFLKEHASGDLTSEQDEIIRRLIMDNADSKRLMKAHLKKDFEYAKMLRDPEFSNKAKALFDTIKANIAAATTELDKLGEI